VSPLPALLLTIVRSFAPCSSSAPTSSFGQARGAEAADHHRRAVGDVGNGVAQRRDLLLDHRLASPRVLAVRARPSIASA
jgi:hypothetical protein